MVPVVRTSRGLPAAVAAVAEVKDGKVVRILVAEGVSAATTERMLGLIAEGRPLGVE